MGAENRFRSTKTTNKSLTGSPRRSRPLEGHTHLLTALLAHNVSLFRSRTASVQPVPVARCVPQRSVVSRQPTLSAAAQLPANAAAHSSSSGLQSAVATPCFCTILACVLLLLNGREFVQKFPAYYRMLCRCDIRTVSS